MNLTCCCTGHRPKGFPFAYGKDQKKHAAYLAALRENIEYVICERGVTRFLSGMALGVDLDFAEIVLSLRDGAYPQISLECVLPCPDQTLKWREADKTRYENLLRRADKVKILSDRYTPDCMLKRNRTVVEQSDCMIAVFNGIKKGGTWYTICYAAQRNIERITIYL